MSNKEFNDFYNMLLAMDEDELEETVLKMAEPVMNRQKEINEKKELEKLGTLRIRRERVM